jgi:hypothetical protein
MLQQPVAMAVRDAVVGAALRIGPVVTTVAGALSGVSVHYPAPRGAHRLVGSRVPDLSLTGAGPGRLYQALRGGRFVAVPGVASGRLDPEAVAAQYGWRGPVSCVTPATPPDSALLVRPDGYLAWAG